MSAEDVKGAGGNEEKGGEEERKANEKRYQTLTCLGLIRAGGFVRKPLALIWGLQHSELIIAQTPAGLQNWVHGLLHKVKYEVYTAYVQQFTITEGLNYFEIYFHKINIYNYASIE